VVLGGTGKGSCGRWGFSGKGLVYG